MVEFHTADTLAPAYAAVRARVRSVIEAAPAAALDGVCPLTPDWRVRDVVAHLAGVPADVLAGRMEGVASDAWTAVQVESRRTMPVAEILDEWDRDGTAVAPLMPAFPLPAIGQFVFDAVTHEFDVFHALGVPAVHDSDAVMCSFDWIRAMGAPPVPLRLRTPSGDHAWGDGTPAGTLELREFDFVRMVCGRRSLTQIAAYVVEGEIDPASMLVAPIFSPAPVDVLE